jgi:flagellar hook protein FlgE
VLPADVQDFVFTFDIEQGDALDGPPRSFGFGADQSISLDFRQLTQFAAMPASLEATRPSQATVPDGDGGTRSLVGGMRAGTLIGISIGSDGVLRGRYSSGAELPLGQIPIARFKNPAGLQAVGNNLFIETANSGSFNGVGEDVSASGGTIMGGALEMSNVDLADEFTSMIVTQRGFQSNSRVITVSDEMLQILNNI